jgi:hypothetical protein
MYKPDKRFIEGERVEIELETTKYKILGRAFLHKNKRFSDLLNDEKGFLVLTDVKVFPLNGKEILFKKEHLMINKDSIVLAWEE